MVTLEQVQGFIRHALTFGGGFLVAKGLIDPEILAEAVGAVVTIVGVVWSWWVKRNATPSIEG